MTAPITILSPHFDDAVLSCWHVLTSAADVRVVNVFAGAPPAGAGAGWWDREGGAGDPADAVRARVGEDRRALALVGREATNLDFLDAQYRLDEQPIEPLVEALAAEVLPETTVYAPAAVGPLPAIQRSPYPSGTPHPDHLALRTAALRLAERGRDLRLYADLPHASVYASAPESWEDVLAAAGLDPLALERVATPLTGEAFERKLEAVRTYASQVAVIEDVFKRRLDDPELLGHEVEWRVKAGALAA